MVMTWTGTDWRTNAYYNTNTNTLQRTYALASTTELPIVGASTSTAGAYTAFTTGYKDLYGVIPNDTSKVATINPSTGHITVPGGITASITGNCTGTAGGVAWSNVTGKPDTYAPASHSHGNLSNAGCITAAITVGDGDYLIIGDNSASGKLGKGPAFVSTTAHKFLKDTGAFTAIAAADLPAATTSAKGAVIVGTGLSVSSGTISVSYGTTASTAAEGNHTHTTSISKTGTATVNLAANTVYTLTAGGTSVVFKTPADTTTNYYHTTGSWSGLTYTATANGGAGALAFTIPTGSTATTVAVGNHNHDTSYLKLSGGTLTGTLGLRTSLTKGTNPSSASGAYIQILETGTGTAAKNRLGMLYCYADTNGVMHNRLYAYRYLADSTAAAYFGLQISSDGATKKTETDALVYGAVWNDYAELRKTNKEAQPGQCVVDNDDGSLSITDKRLLPGASVVSDTFGFAIGETETTKTPLAVSGRVLVYTYRDRAEYHAGMAVCSAPNGTVDIMTREEIMMYPDCIIGIVSEIPEYETWGTGNVKVNNRIWIKVR